MYIDFCVIVFQPINIGEQERQGMMFTTIARAKYLNGLRFQLSFSNNQYENMTKLTWVKIRIVEENSLKSDHNEDFVIDYILITHIFHHSTLLITLHSNTTIENNYH